MRVLIQRVKEASVRVGGDVVGSIGKGILILIGIANDDTDRDCEYMVNKVVNLRIFSDDENLMNRSLLDIDGSALVVSQFTLLGDCRKGRRPSFANAAPPDLARNLYNLFVEMVRRKGVHVETGVFQEMMEVHLVNDGPVTLLIDSKKIF